LINGKYETHKAFTPSTAEYIMTIKISDSDLATTSLWLNKIKQSPNNHIYKLLIVDDQPEIRNLLSLTLDAENYEVHYANDWITALGMARAIRPDLMLLDIMMPGEFDGLEVCRRIKNDKELSSIIIMIISARAQIEDRNKGMASGADDYLAKPFSPLTLMEKVSQLLAKKTANDEPSR